jgi:uncharacterized membrane protein
MNPTSQPIEVTTSDKQWALCAYLFTPLVPAVMLLIEDVKNRPYIRAHLAQALVLGMIGFVVNSLLSAVLIGCVTWPLYVGLLIYYGIKAYHGEKIVIPVISGWVTSQGWNQ